MAKQIPARVKSAQAAKWIIAAASEHLDVRNFLDDDDAIDEAADLVRQARLGLRKRDESAQMIAGYEDVVRSHATVTATDDGARSPLVQPTTGVSTGIDKSHGGGGDT